MNNVNELLTTIALALQSYALLTATSPTTSCTRWSR